MNDENLIQQEMSDSDKAGHDLMCRMSELCHGTDSGIVVNAALNLAINAVRQTESAEAFAEASRGLRDMADHLDATAPKQPTH
jgi:hypothetical protein